MKRDLIVVSQKFGKRFSGMALWPFIFVKNDRLAGDKVFLNHERIHLRQQLELGIVPFYLWYVLEYGLRVLKYRDRYLAYRNIGFEREAYASESDMKYLKRRKCWSFLKFL